jgi:hypothetical protein
VVLLRLNPSFPVAPAVLASCSVLAAAAPLGAATVEAKRSFDLPRGDAATTLRQFAATAGRSLVFVTDKVRGETTNAVRGDLTPRWSACSPVRPSKPLKTPPPGHWS